MNSIQTNLSNVVSYSSLGFSNQRSTGSMTPPPNYKRQSEVDLNSRSYIKTDATSKALQSIEVATRNINNAIALVQSVDGSAAIIESKLVDMKTLAIQGSECACQAMRKAQESIGNVANGFSWNRTNFMVGGGENNQKTTLRNFVVNTGQETTDDLQINFKSFNPMSAVDTDGSLEPTTPNLPDLNKSSGTDTHAYGNAALYSKLSEDSYLHTHTNAMREQAVIQLSRAIDGVKSERERLGGYLKQLNNIAETNQSKFINKSNYISQRIDAEHAHQIAISSKNEILKNLGNKILAQLNIKDFELPVLLN